MALEEKPIGFALVRQIEEDVYSMAEFFVLRKHRKTGIGRSAAFLLFDRFPGTWHVAQDEFNLPAQRFWRRTIGDYTDGDYTDGDYTESWSDAQPRGPKQVFRSV